MTTTPPPLAPGLIAGLKRVQLAHFRPVASEILQTDGIKPTARRLPLRGITDEVSVYEIP